MHRPKEDTIRQPTTMFAFLPDQNLQWSSLQGYTFIMPAVSVGNIGQLAVDLLISSLQLVKFARLDHPVFLPVVGSDPYSHREAAGLTTAAELYVSREKRLVVLQIRSLLVREHRSDFLASLVDWMTQCQFSNTVLLSSCHSYERVDSQLTGSPFRYTVNSSVAPDTVEELGRLQWTPLEPRRSGHGHAPADQTSLFYPGGGFTAKLHKLCDAGGVAFVTLLIFCSEGDNIAGVLLVANQLDRWMKLVATHNNAPAWKFPASWKHFFGNPPPVAMY